MTTLPLLAVALLAGFPSSTSGQDQAPLADEPLHADLPLFGDAFQDKWPQSFSDRATGDFGCSSRVRFGDWKLTRGDREDAPEWYRFSNYGAFHCWANVAHSSEREQLQSAESRPTFFVRLGQSDAVELWALQIGARPGSDYILLSRRPEGKAITSFNVLQRECDARAMRRSKDNVEILRTDYCVVRSQADLIGLARRAAALPPLGNLTLAPDSSAPFGSKEGEPPAK